LHHTYIIIIYLRMMSQIILKLHFFKIEKHQVV